MRTGLALEVAGVAAGAAAAAVARRAVRGPRRPSWTLRTELTASVMRALVMRSRHRGVHWLRRAQALAPLGTPLADRVAFEREEVGGVPALVCRPRDAEPTAAVVHLHGGGYVIGEAAGSRDALARLALGLPARVVGVDYRLAPEHPFPAAQEDALAATRAVLAQTPAGRVALAGDSAGAALCVATLCALRDAGAPLPAAAVLLCPWTDPLRGGGSLETNADADFADHALLLDWIRIAAAGADPTDPRLSVVRARLEGLPPLLVQAGGAEILLDPICDFAETARRAGVEVELRVWEDMFHDFQMAAAQLPEGAAAMEEAVTFLRKRVAS